MWNMKGKAKILLMKLVSLKKIGISIVLGSSFFIDYHAGISGR